MTALAVRQYASGTYRLEASGIFMEFSLGGASVEKQGAIHIDSLDQLDQSGFMVKEVGAYEAKTHFSQLLKQVEKGETVYITRHGKRVAELQPAKPRKKAKFGCAKGPGFYMAPDFDEPLEEFKDYM